MDEKIKQKCEEAGISPEILTAEEKERLRKEIEAEESGRVILDGVLSDPKILFREHPTH